ncbi:MAG: hypothetical protein MJY62_00670 [Bacteroidales bacterium]|nr:hypothetical protein [Bacteroidales bacterium]
MIASWWESLDLFMKILWSLTLTASAIFLIQSIMTFVGIGGDADGLDGLDGADGADAPDSLDPGMNLYTFRNLVNFILGFGWMAIACYGKVTSIPLLVLISLLAGVVLVAGVMYLFKWLYGMQQSGNIDLQKDALGCEGTVYLSVPGHREGEGQVQITINSSVREYHAVTDGGPIKTGAAIKVVDTINSTTLLVEPAESEII